MLCPVCKADTFVIDTRTRKLEPILVRIRICKECKTKFTTEERTREETIRPPTIAVREQIESSS